MSHLSTDVERRGQTVSGSSPRERELRGLCAKGSDCQVILLSNGRRALVGGKESWLSRLGEGFSSESANLDKNIVLVVSKD